MPATTWRHPAVLASVSFYALCLFHVAVAGQSIVEPLFGLVVLGILFPVLTWYACRRLTPVSGPPRQLPRDRMLLATALVVICAWLVAGKALPGLLLPAAPPPAQDVLNLVIKLVVFVAIPLALFHFLSGARPAELGFTPAMFPALRRGHWRMVVIVGGAMCLLQFFLGSGAAPLRQGQLTLVQVGLGLPLALAWLTLEAGVVEEFFFRALLQDRLAVWLRSDAAAIAVMALVFALSHVPGYVLRDAGAVEGVGGDAGVLLATSHVVVTLAPGAIFLGIAWMRTRNLAALALIHGAIDLLPNLDEFVVAWGI